MPWLHSKRFWCLVFLILLGVLRGLLWKPTLPNISLDQVHDVCGTVGNPSEFHANGQKVILKELLIDYQKMGGKLSVFLDKKFKRVYVGDRLCFTSVIKSIRNFKTPGEFDVERYYFSQGIWGKCLLGNFALHGAGGAEQGFPHFANAQVGKARRQDPRYTIEKIREKFSLFLEKYKHGAILKALLLGIKNLPKETEEDFIKSGLIHLLVISGQNVGFILIFSLSFLYFILSRFEIFLLYLNIQKVIIFISFFLIGFFYFLSGGALPVLRASLMSSCFLLSMGSSKSHSGFYSLCWAIAGILNFMPSSLLDPSFQLSFASTAGLIGLIHWNKKWFWVLSPGVCAIATLPIVLYHFHRFSLISIISNLVVVPYVSFLVLPFSLMIMALYFCFESLASYLMIFLNPLIDGFIALVHFFASFSWSSVYCMTPHIGEIILWYGGIGSIVYFRIFGIAIILICIFIFQFNLESFLRNQSPYLSLSFLSVGQGDCTFVQLPKGKNMLIDGGGIVGFDIGERIVAPFLWKKRVRKIDYLVLSHSDFDHSGGIPFIIEHFKISEIWLSQWKSKTKIFYKILHLAQEKNIPCFLISQKTQPKKLEEVKWIFLNPAHSFEKKRINNLSLVFQLKYQNFSALFTGDIEKEIEEKLAIHPIRSTILKVPHHGSKTSSSFAFLKKVSPKWAVISSGWNNHYGHPHDSIVNRYTKLNIPTWRTDSQGTLEVMTNGKVLYSVY